MNSGNYKLCPRCGNTAGMDATACRKCGATYRTLKSEGVSSVTPAEAGLSLTPLPTHFHRPSETHPEFAAPDGMPPTYHDLPNIDVLRRSLSEALSKHATPTSQPVSQLFFDSPPFPSPASQMGGTLISVRAELADRRFDWKTPETLLDAIIGADDATPRNGADVDLFVRPVIAQGVEIEIDEQNYLTINDLLPYDKARTRTNPWYRYGSIAVLFACFAYILSCCMEDAGDKPADVASQTIIAFLPGKASPNVAVPAINPKSVIVDQNGDMIKPEVIVKKSAINGLNSAVFSQLSSANPTVGLLDVAPANVAVLPLNGETGADGMSSNNDGLSGNTDSAGAFSQTHFQMLKFKFRHYRVSVTR